MRGLIGGILTGGLVSVLGLGAASVVSELPAGLTPPEAPLVDAPQVEPVAVQEDTVESPSTPVGSISIVEPLAPALPEGEAALEEPVAPTAVDADVEAPRADTDPLDEPDGLTIEGTLEAPDASESANLLAAADDPVLPNPQSLAPQAPVTEADLTVSTAPAQPTVVVEPDVDDVAIVVDDVDAPEADTEGDDFFVVDLGAETAGTEDEAAIEIDEAEAKEVPFAAVLEDAPADQLGDDVFASGREALATPRFQLQGGQNTLLGERDTGVTVRRPAGEGAPEENEVALPDVTSNALVDFAADAGDFGAKPLLSIVLIDDGSMSAAAAALSGLPFSVTIALDASLENAAALMEDYRGNGFEIAVLTKLPEGAVPSDVEVTFESIFRALPETIAVLDLGDSGLQTDREVTQQAMDILSAQGRGFISASQGLNMAGRAAEQSGVPAAVIYRDLDREVQDARVIRRFVDQAAFRARQESGVVLVGRVRPDTISALILWGTANQDDQIAIVPVSAILNAQ